MHKRLVFSVISRIILISCVAMLAPLGIALAENWQSIEVLAFVKTILFGVVLAGSSLLIFRVDKKKKLGAKDGLAIVGFSWVFLSFIGALPLYLSGVAGFTDSLFEIVSGFTTTGASIFTNIEGLPRGILFWRSLTQWLGGMGVIVLYVALLPVLGVSAFQLYKAEASGLNIDRDEPKIKETARNLWGIYFLLSIVLLVCLKIAGMDMFDALCHTFTTVSTGGFSTKNVSMGFYGGTIQWIITVFMFLAGINFSLHFQAFSGKPLTYFKNEEFKIYIGATIVLVIIFSGVLGNIQTVIAPLRESVFQIVSVMTTTGYTSVNFDLWPNTLRFLLFLLMFIGGCGGSTVGGMKIIRIFLVIKIAFRSIFQTALPNAIKPIRNNNNPISEKIVVGVMAYFSIFMVLFFGASFLFLWIEGCSFETAMGASISALGNIGPGLDQVGATKNFAWVSSFGKWLLMFLMLAGRLELYAFLILFVPAVWKK